MEGNVRLPALRSDILRYIVENERQPGEKLPTIQQIGKALGTSVAKTRESLEVARALGAVAIKPGRGTEVAEYRFEPAVTLSALYAIGQDFGRFEDLRQMRNALEVFFWEDVVQHLTEETLACLRALINSANERLSRTPFQVPAAEHRQFHLTIFAGLNNCFVLGMMESYWEVYEAFGLNMYADLDYLWRVWGYHERMVDAIEAGDIETSRRLLIEHMNLLSDRKPTQNPTQQPDIGRFLFE
jgi:DNA-binding FadR family transcriptional regulator